MNTEILNLDYLAKNYTITRITTLLSQGLVLLMLTLG